MARSMRFWLTTALIFAAVGAPVTAYSRVEDEYAYNSARLSLSLEYENREYDSMNAKTDSSQFRQIYALNFTGKILSRNLIVYNAQAILTKNISTQSSGAKQDTKMTTYGLNTTLLPKSRIPLTLLGSRNTTGIASNGGSASSSVNTNYGMDWLGRFTTLPETTLSYRNSKNESGANASLSEYYTAHLRKKIGPTSNEANFSKHESTPNTNTNSKSTSTGINASNITHLSKTTRFDARGTKHDAHTNTATNVNADTQGLSLLFDSKPSDEFRQNHSYSFASAKTGVTSTEGNFYSGIMGYDIRRKLQANLNVTDNKTLIRTDQSKSTTHSTSSGAGLTYTAGLLSLSQTLAYSKSETNAPNSTSPLLNNSSFSSTTSAGYNRFFGFGSAGVSARLGYVEAKANEKTGLKGISEGMGANASAHKLDYATLSASASYTQVENKAGDRSKNREFSYNASSANKLWAKYVNLAVSYNKYYSRSWIVERYTTGDTYALNASTSYFSGTSLGLGLSHSNYDNRVNGATTTDTKTFYLGRAFVFLNSTLNSSINRNVSETGFPGGSQSIVSTTYNLDYSKMLLQSVNWTARAFRTESKTDNKNFSNTGTLATSLGYMLRSWAISANYSYTSNERTGYKSSESSYFARLSREFGIIY
ncbi:MAG: hypothetical protein HY884_00580 [Deltaproteobacteria bacterium]|nr:hypothetical protein [Deltaproteobacteria bacterium]